MRPYRTPLHQRGRMSAWQHKSARSKPQRWSKCQWFKRELGHARHNEQGATGMANGARGGISAWTADEHACPPSNSVMWLLEWHQELGMSESQQRPAVKTV